MADKPLKQALPGACPFSNDDQKPITIASPDGGSRMRFLPSRGALADSLVFSAREILFQHDFIGHSAWPDLPGGWPFCFPICGRQAIDGQVGAYRLQDQTYHLPIHGFAWQMPWQVDAIEDHSVQFSLRANEVTRRIYPFDFEVRLHYRIDVNRLTCDQSYINHGDEAMPYAAGFHPYFKMPSPAGEKTKVEIDFKAARGFVYNDDMTDIIAEKEGLHMPRSVADPLINEQLSELADDHAVTLTFADSSKLHLQVDGQEGVKGMFSYLQLYTLADQSFFCVEPWTAAPNAMNNRLGLRFLKPGQREQARLELTFSPPENNA